MRDPPPDLEMPAMSIVSESGNHAWPSLKASVSMAPAGVELGISVTSLDDGRSFSAGATRLFAAASTIKLLILVALTRAVDDQRLSLDDMAASGPGTKAEGSGVLNWLHDGLMLPLRDHAWLMIAVSDNTASNILIDAVGMDAIAATARDLDLSATALNRRFLGRKPEPGMPENYTTADNLVAILTAIWSNRAASTEQCSWMKTVLAEQKYRNRIPRMLPDAVTYAGKTGSLDGIVHDCGVITGPGGNCAIAILTEGFADPYAAEAFAGQLTTAIMHDLSLAP